MAARFQTYAQFWPFYLGEHAKPSTRAVHYVGSIASVAALLLALITRDWWLLLAVPLLGYGPAWFGHFFIEKNRPATFTYPGWSFISDFRMCALMWMGRLGSEVARHVPAH
jgi:hypothetical protein